GHCGAVTAERTQWRVTSETMAHSPRGRPGGINVEGALLAASSKFLQGSSRRWLQRALSPEGLLLAVHSWASRQRVMRTDPRRHALMSEGASTSHGDRVQDAVRRPPSARFARLLLLPLPERVYVPPRPHLTSRQDPMGRAGSAGGFEAFGHMGGCAEEGVSDREEGASCREEWGGSAGTGLRREGSIPSLSRPGTYSLKCYSCTMINNFNCPVIHTCVYEIRRCLTISIRLNTRELLVYKNCTNNCTFVYPEQVPPEAPRKVKTTHFYYVRCCGAMLCNEGGPTNMERDILPEVPIEEEIEGTERVGGPGLLLSLASLLAGRALT
ncbi:Glycosyl-phosphatidylinositol-anchored molecule-like protein, partial [Galemys pyrenaicus]